MGNVTAQSEYLGASQSWKKMLHFQKCSLNALSQATVAASSRKKAETVPAGNYSELFLIFRGLSIGFFACSAFRMVSRVCLARSLSLLSREDTRFCTSLSRYSHLISASGNSLLLPSVSP